MNRINPFRIIALAPAYLVVQIAAWVKGDGIVHLPGWQAWVWSAVVWWWIVAALRH